MPRTEDILLPNLSSAHAEHTLTQNTRLIVKADTFEGHPGSSKLVHLIGNIFLDIIAIFLALRLTWLVKTTKLHSLIFALALFGCSAYLVLGKAWTPIRYP